MHIQFLSLLCFLSLPLCHCSLFDPHVFPNKGPFFEGWYLRITDFTNSHSVGLLFGSVLPKSDIKSSAPLVVASVLMRNCSGKGESGTCKLISVDGKFTPDQLNITLDGGIPVSKDPDRKSPSNFRWQVTDKLQGGFFRQTGNETTWVFKIGDILFRGAADNPFPWDSSGSGPEGWLSYLPLPLHWFVFSLRSRLLRYDIQNVTSGETIRGNNGVVHLEKNWGKSFPKSWIWSEGVSADTKSNASYAITSGVVDFSFLSVPAHLIGYRNPATGVKVSFRPDNSYVVMDMDSCKGLVNITITSLSYRVVIELSGQPKSFSSCLLGPETEGFERACVESYDAEAHFQIFKRKSFIFSDYVRVEEQTFHSVALEFGGLNVCKDACSGKV